MFIARGNRRIGRWSALLAAYAFVLNALLATTLLAATQPSKSLSGFELCTSGHSAVSPLDHDDQATKRAAVHCQLCLQHAAPVALPPASPAALPLPLVQVAIVAFICSDALTFDSSYSPHSPRGPPHLG